MGLLDDAIREHLELKRRHGADPDEVSRQEREALGAPVRGEFAKPAEAGAEAPADTDEASVAEAPEVAVDEPEPVGPEPEPAPEEPEDVAEPTPGTEEDPWLVEDLAVEEPQRAAPEPDVVRADEEQDEDVLEETPEFLQETPEHDRLWFEQKPPRNFDWDK
jgi:hypothetical protein